MTDYSTIGGLRDALTPLDLAAKVYVNGRPPTALSSYRGFYDHLAIERANEVHNERTELDGRGEPFEMNMAGYGTYEPGNGEVRIKFEPTVADLIQALDLADGAEFEGYKGGQFYMNSDTELWVSEHGSCESLRIVAVTESPGRIDLGTFEVDF